MNHLHRVMLAALSAVAEGCVDTGAGGPTIADVAADQLSIQPSIIDDDPAPADGKVPIVVQFYRGTQFVELASNSVVICNGVPIPWSTVGYTARVPLVAPGGSLAFVHSRTGVTTQAVVKVPPRPVLTSPMEGELLGRLAPLTLHYAASSSAGVRPGASDGKTALNGNEQPDNGTATLDVGMLGAGAGTVQISRRVVSTPTGTGFASVLATYTIVSPVTRVTWQ